MNCLATSAQQKPYEQRIISAKERRELVPYSDMQIWRMEKEGRFPKRVKLGPNRVGWVLQEVLDWQEALIASRDGEEVSK